MRHCNQIIRVAVDENFNFPSKNQTMNILMIIIILLKSFFTLEWNPINKNSPIEKKNKQKQREQWVWSLRVST